MAIFHYQVRKPYIRRAGSALAVKGHHSGTRVSHGAGGRHAYLSASRHISEDGLVTDYRGKAVIAHFGCLPDGTRQRNIDDVFREVDAYPVKKSHKGKVYNPVVAIDSIGAIPHELSQAQQVEAARDFGQRVSNTLQVPVAVGVHPPENDNRNVHCHVLIACRTINKDGILSVYNRDLNAMASRPDRKIGKERTELPVIRLKRIWETTMNEHLARANIPERIDMRSYKEQGIEQVPTRHLGKARFERQKAQRQKRETRQRHAGLPAHEAAYRLKAAVQEAQGRLRLHRKSIEDIQEARKQSASAVLSPGVGSLRAYERDAIGQFLRDMERQNALNQIARSRRLKASRVMRDPTEEERLALKRLGRTVRKTESEIARIEEAARLAARLGPRTLSIHVDDRNQGQWLAAVERELDRARHNHKARSRSI